MSARPARILDGAQSETAYGGLATVWSELALIWVALTPGAPRDASTGDAPPLRIETASALARDDARLHRGQRLAFAGEPPWTVTGVDHSHPRPGRMTLRLER